MTYSKPIIIALSILLTCDIMAQVMYANNDSFQLRRDIPLNYNLYVLNNDSTAAGGNTKITSVNKIGPTAGRYNLTFGPDSSFLIITDNVADSFNGEFTYIATNSVGSFDSATVTFERVELTPDVYPGDGNKDNLVNHLDIFSLGVMFDRYGSSRHNTETNTTFTPKRAEDWFFQVKGINGKHADVNGDSRINYADLDSLKLNIGKSSGNYAPILSDTNNVQNRTIQFSFQDTILASNIDSNKIKIPIQIANPISSYGIAYSLSVLNQDENSNQDTFYPKYSYQSQTDNIWSDQTNNEILNIEDKVSQLNHTNIAYCKTNSVNGDLSGDLGVVEIIVDEIIWGLADPGDLGRIHLRIKDVALIDNNYNFISIKPVSKYIYIKKTLASISGNSKSTIAVYPTVVQAKFIIEKTSSKSASYSIFNSLGQKVHSGQLKDMKTTIQSESWNTGLYYLRIQNSESVFKLIKR